MVHNSLATWYRQVYFSNHYYCAAVSPTIGENVDVGGGETTSSLWVPLVVGVLGGEFWFYETFVQIQVYSSDLPMDSKRLMILFSDTLKNNDKRARLLWVDKTFPQQEAFNVWVRVRWGNAHSENKTAYVYL